MAAPIQQNFLGAEHGEFTDPFFNRHIQVLPSHRQFLYDAIRHHYHKNMPFRPGGKADMDRKGT